MAYRSAASAARLLAGVLTVCILALTILAAPAPLVPNAHADSKATGHWTGKVQIPGTPLDIDVDIAAAAGGAWTGDISIPAQGAKDMPLEAIVVEGARIEFRIAGIPGDPTFRGSMAEDGTTISGTFTQAGQEFPFQLTGAQSPAASARAALEGFDAVVEQTIAGFKVPGVAIAIIAGGKPVLMKGYGKRDIERDLPVTEKTLFAIGSSTKAFTAFVLGTLVDEGKLAWDASLLDYIPDFRLDDKDIERHITPRDLVTHRCGLPRHDLVWYNNTELSRREIVARMAHLEANKGLRETWQYNNLAFLTAGYLAETITSKTWEECVRERILDPLGMGTANFSVEESQKSPDFALGYREKDEQILRMPFRTITNMGPAGSINANVEEMSRWVALQLAGGKHDGRALIQEATLAELQTPQMVIAAPLDPNRPETPQVSYAMGWFVQPYRGHYRLHHGGNIDGFSAFVSFLPQDDIGIVILTNKNGTGVPELLEKIALDRILGIDGKDWLAEALEKRAKGLVEIKEAESKAETVRVKGTKPSHPLQDYAGEYEHPGYGTIVVSRQGSSLLIDVNHIANPLEHWHYDVFNCVKGAPDPAFEGTKIQFVTDMNGNIDGLRVSAEPLVDDIVFARKPDARLRDPAFLARLAGAYALSDEVVRVEVKGTGLILVVPGQPVYDLSPDRGTTFKLKGVSGYSIVFVLSPDDEVQEMQIIQPNGVYTAKPKAS